MLPDGASSIHPGTSFNFSNGGNENRSTDAMLDDFEDSNEYILEIIFYVIHFILFVSVLCFCCTNLCIGSLFVGDIPKTMTEVRFLFFF